MKKVFSTLLLLPMVLYFLAGCNKVEELSPGDPGTQPIVAADSVWTVSIQAVREQSDSDTKGLAIGDGEPEATTKSLQCIWKANEPVEVYLDGNNIGTLRATPSGSDPHKATLSGTVTAGSITPGVTRLTLLTPRQDWDYTGQVGRLLLQDDPNNQGDDNRSIEKKYLYMMAQDILVTEASSGGNGKSTLTTEDASFANQQSVYRLSFRFQHNGAGDKYPIYAKSVRITAAGGGLVQSQNLDGSSVTGPISVILDNSTAEPFFVALRNQNTTETEDLNFQVTDNEGITYYGSKSIPAQYKHNGTFVSVKNATLTGRLELSEHQTTVTEAL